MTIRSQPQDEALTEEDQQGFEVFDDQATEAEDDADADAAVELAEGLGLEVAMEGEAPAGDVPLVELMHMFLDEFFAQECVEHEGHEVDGEYMKVSDVHAMVNEMLDSMKPEGIGGGQELHQGAVSEQIWSPQDGEVQEVLESQLPNSPLTEAVEGVAEEVQELLESQFPNSQPLLPVGTEAVESVVEEMQEPLESQLPNSQPQGPAGIEAFEDVVDLTGEGVQQQQEVETEEEKLAAARAARGIDDNMYVFEWGQRLICVALAKFYLHHIYWMRGLGLVLLGHCVCECLHADYLS